MSRILVSLLWVVATGAAVEVPRLESPYVFTDRTAVVRVPGVAGEVAYSLRTITPAGWGPSAEQRGPVADGQLAVAPLSEGIHILTLALAPPVELRFLAIEPPPALSRVALRRHGARLLGGEPFTILAMGDSVTATGDYPQLLAQLLSRATGNTNLTVVTRAYSGRSVDATVRNFAQDAAAARPHLGLLMYGLNDQGGGVAPAAYLEQCQWVADRLARDCDADAMFLTPTPDLSRRPDTTTYGPHLFRTIGFAALLENLGRDRNVPVADAFGMIWGAGGATLDDCGRAMWPKFPISFGRPFSSVLETDGRGDGVHPNALGHLAIARAVFAAMAGAPPAARLRGVSEWTPTGLVSRVTLAPDTTVFPLPDDTVEAGPDEVRWPTRREPVDLLQYPANHYRTPMFVAFVKGRPQVVEAPVTGVVEFVRERSVVTGATVSVRRGADLGPAPLEVEIPPAAEVGRIPLAREHAVAELAYVRFGAARGGEATVDGDLTEWTDHTWVPVGEPVQARGPRGLHDQRAAVAECALRWAFKAGTNGLFVAAQLTGVVDRDSFTLFFDPRAPAELGTPGRYYWVNGHRRPDGRLELKRGETSPAAPGLAGVWRAGALELFIPYDLLETTAWPVAGDLGASIIWNHVGPHGEKTTLMWAEDGHPWNPRWYGVVRLLTDPTAPRPYRVRIK